MCGVLIALRVLIPLLVDSLAKRRISITLNCQNQHIAFRCFVSILWPKYMLVHAWSLTIVHACTMAIVFACSRAIVHACTIGDSPCM